MRYAALLGRARLEVRVDEALAGHGVAPASQTARRCSSRSLRSQRLSEWAFGHYLRVAPPEFALPAPPVAVAPQSAQVAA